MDRLQDEKLLTGQQQRGVWCTVDSQNEAETAVLMSIKTSCGNDGDGGSDDSLVE